MVALEIEVNLSMEVKVHPGTRIVSIGMFRPIPVCLCVWRGTSSTVLYHNGRPADLNARRRGLTGTRGDGNNSTAQKDEQFFPMALTLHPNPP